MDQTLAAGRRSLGASVGLWVRAVRPFSYPLSLMPLLVATAAVRPISQWRWDVLAASVLGSLGLATAGNLLNDYFDFRHGVDTRPDEPGRPGRLLVRGDLTPGQVLRGALVAGAVSLLAALWLARLTAPWVLGFVLLGLAGAYAYTGPPFQLKYRGLGELCVFATFGPALMSGAACAQTGRVPGAVLALSVPVGLAVTSVVAANNRRDAAEDAAARIRTLAHLLGARRMSLLCAALAVGGAAGIAGVGVACRVPQLIVSILTLPLALPPVRAMLQGRTPPDVDARMARYVLALGATTLAALLWTSGL